MDLSEQLRKLDEAILGAVETDFPEPLSESGRALVSAYLVLAHAVLEEALEDAFSEVYDRLAQSLSEKFIPVESAHFVYAVSRWVPEKISNGQAAKNLHPFLTKACRQEFVKKISSNHGLKAENVKSMSKLLGLDWDVIEDRFNSELADLNTLGSKRGSAGHLSPYSVKATGLTTNVDPEDVRGWVASGLVAITSVQKYLAALASGLSNSAQLEAGELIELPTE